MNKKKWTHWVRLLAGVLISSIIAWEIARHESILEAFLSLNSTNVLLGSALLIPNIGFTLLRWHYILKRGLGRITLRESSASLLLGYGLGLITPGRLGDLGRGLYFTDKDRSFITGLNLFDKLAAQLAIALLGYASIVYMLFTRELLPDWRNFVLAGGGLYVLILFLLVFFPQWMGRQLSRLGGRIPERYLPNGFFSALATVKLQDSLFLVGASIVWTFILVLQYHILISGFTEVTIFTSFLAVTATFLAKMLLPLTFGDLGIREGIAVYFYSCFAIPAAAAFNTSLLIFLFNVLLPGLLGSYFLLKIRVQKKADLAVETTEPPVPAKIGLDRLGGVQDG